MGNKDAFKGCPAPTELCLWKEDFKDSAKLQEIHIRSKNPYSIKVEDNAFIGVLGCILYVPDGTENDYRSHPNFSVFECVMGESELTIK